VIAKRTVLILGAGASYAECRFPMGHELAVNVRDVCRGLMNNPNVGQMIHDCGIPLSMGNDFADLIDDSGGTSIDELLESRTDYLNIGKAAIAAVLMPWEDGNTLCKMDRRDKSWYAYLLKQMKGKFEDLHKNALTIVTFNYDRSLDWFLRRSIMNFYNRSLAEVEKVLESIPIIHVHGQLGSLAENPYGRWDPKSVMNQHYIAALKRAKDGIQIVHEVDTQSPDSNFGKVQKTIGIAETVALLGFGFGTDNLKRLKIRGSSNASIFATAYGLTQKQMADIRNVVAKPITFGNPNEGILEFLNRVECL
jgi:hypothetical protein